MIITKLIGGLGNQLFQYSLGRELALRRNTELLLDSSAFKTYKRHPYSLSFFNIKERSASRWQISKLKIANAFSSSKPYYQRPIITETDQSFDPKILEAPAAVYLSGYWQSEKYFKQSADSIRKDINLKDAGDKRYLSVLDRIRGSNSISVHIRRANYLTMGKGIFEPITLGYYRDAVARIARNLDSAEVFIFSDDIAWVKSNLSLPLPCTFVSENNFADYQELMLMSACKHNITANSSFSWWGAWLNNNPNKIVVTPEKWFVDPKRSNADLAPESWIRM